MSKVLDIEIIRAVIRMFLFLVLALAFIWSKYILSKAMHWAVPVEGGALISVFDAVAEFALVSAAIIITLFGAFEVAWVVGKSALESTIWSKSGKDSDKDES